MFLKVNKRDDSLCSESGKLFHARGAAMAIAKVERRVHGTTRCDVDNDLGLCLASSLATA